MKKIFIALAILSVFACNSGNNTNKNNTEDERVQVQESTNSTVIDPVASNPNREAIYEEIVPCADCPGIKYNLEIWKKYEGKDSVYRLAMTYLEAENGEDRTYDSEGRWRTIEHVMGNKNVVLYRLTPVS